MKNNEEKTEKAVTSESASTATPPPLGRPIPDSPGIKDLFEALLRQPEALSRHGICEERRTLFYFGAIAFASLLVFGFVLGTFAYGDQLWAAPLKLGGGLFFAGLICFPSMYIFSSLAGSRVSIAKTAGIMGGMLALAGLLLTGFAPALWIFAQGTSSVGFMGALALVSWLVALCFAFRFLRIAMRAAGAIQDAPMMIWSGIFILVSLQLSTSLRPILGRSDELLSSEKKFFLQHWIETAGESLDTAPVSPVN